jgi:serine/threonine protein kinase
LERFIGTWEEGTEPVLAEFLPTEPPLHRRLVLIELIKVDLEQRTALGCLKELSAYTTDFPELLENGEPPCDLIYEEYHIRRGAGHSVTPRHYYERFPRSAEALKRLMGTEDLSQSTQLFTAKRIEGFAPGQRLDDFDLLIELGKGAFGSVFLARQISMQRLVALKISADKGNEPQTLATLDHPNIIRVYDQRRIGEQRIRMLYMQFAPGGTLADVVRQVRETPPANRTGKLLINAVSESLAKSGTMGSDDSPWRKRVAAAGWPETVCRIGVQLAQALDYAHTQGILHRDVKPANILLGADGSPKLADFNISFCSQLDGASPAAYFGGSLAYMSPEQLEACNPTHDRQPQDLDGRSDLFGLAVVLWEMLFGERPFRDDEMLGGWTQMLSEMTERRQTQPPMAPPGVRDPVTMRLEHVLRRALSPDADARHADGEALARELLLCLNPRAWDLVHDLGRGWRSFARRYPILALFPVNLPPFLLASIYNYYYNRDEFIDHVVPDNVPNHPVMQAFTTMFWPVNFILFPLGVVLVLYYAWPMARAVRSLVHGNSPPLEELLTARMRSLRLGHWIAWVGLTLWIVAGIAFPVGIHLLAGDRLSDKTPYTITHLYAHFLASMFLCGLISCSFPFLATTWLSVRAYFPTLLASAAPEPGEQRRLWAVSQWAGRYLVGAVVVPFFATAVLVASGSDEGRHYTIILILASVIGFIAAYFTYQRIRADLAALSIATRPIDQLGTTTDTAETF